MGHDGLVVVEEPDGRVLGEDLLGFLDQGDFFLLIPLGRRLAQVFIEFRVVVFHVIAGGLGIVCARAGVGKTAFLVQIALNIMLHGRSVLHVSLHDSVDKIGLWYQEVLSNLSEDRAPDNADPFMERLLPCRFIMNYRAEGFTTAVLGDRIADLAAKGVFNPDMAILDGWEFSEEDRESLQSLKKTAQERSLCFWLTLRTHRHQAPSQSYPPPCLSGIEDLFDVILQLDPKGKEVHVNCIKGRPDDRSTRQMLLDPSTMLVLSQ